MIWNSAETLWLFHRLHSHDSSCSGTWVLARLRQSFLPRVNVYASSMESQKIQKKSAMMTKWRHLGLLYSRSLTLFRDLRKWLYCADLRWAGGATNLGKGRDGLSTWLKCEQGVFNLQFWVKFTMKCKLTWENPFRGTKSIFPYPRSCLN